MTSTATAQPAAPQVRTPSQRKGITIASHTAGVLVVDAVRGRSMAGSRLGKFIVSDAVSEYVLRDIVQNSIRRSTEGVGDPTADDTDDLLSEALSLGLGMFLVGMASSGSTSFSNVAIDVASAIGGRMVLERGGIVESQAVPAPRQ